MAHNNTVLAQLLKLIDRHDFQKLHSGLYKPQRRYRALSQWSQFTVMMFAHITGRASLRDICDSLQAQTGRLYHLGINPVIPVLACAGDENCADPQKTWQDLLFAHKWFHFVRNHRLSEGN